MEQETEALIKELPFSGLSALEISGEKWKNFGFASYKNVFYPDFDVCAQKLKSQFDIIIAEQVFEHLLWPYRAGKNIFDMTAPRGYFLVTTPFLIKKHEVPVDCSRWTEIGMKYFLAECGFPLDQIVTGSWGNMECVVSNFNRWTVYRKESHSLVNDPEFPMVVWALARK
jgi:SAM-dependent methyltransferase